MFFILIRQGAIIAMRAKDVFGTAQAENLSNKAAKAEQYLQWQSRWLAIKHILLESDLGNCYRQLNANKEKQNHIASEIVRLTNEQQGHVSALSAQSSRSEERRVGKECRSRWSPYH